MTNYRKTIFSYRFLENTPENYAELVGYGVTPEGLYPGIGVLINVELDKVADTITIDQFAEQYEYIPD